MFRLVALLAAVSACAHQARPRTQLAGGAALIAVGALASSVGHESSCLSSGCESGRLGDTLAGPFVESAGTTFVVMGIVALGVGLFRLSREDAAQAHKM
jgi:hypothetical protein